MAEGGTPNFGQAPLPCDICDNTDNVIWNCVDCKANLCVKCYNDHLEGKPWKIFKNHNVVSVEEALRSRYSAEQCSIHPTHVYILHCNTCQLLVCPSCIIDDHKSHDLCQIEDAMTIAFKNVSEYAEVIENSLLPQCNALRRKIGDNIKECENWYARHENQVQSKREELMTELHRHCDELLQAVSIEKEKSMEPVEKDKTLVEAKAAELKTSLEVKDNVMKKKNSEIIQFAKNKPVIEDIILPTVRPIQLPSYMGKRIDSLLVVQTYGTSDEQWMPCSGSETGGDEYKAPHQDGRNEEAYQTPQNASVQPIAQFPTIDIDIKSRNNLRDPVDNIDTNCEDTAWVSSLNGEGRIQVDIEGKQQLRVWSKARITHFRILPNGDIVNVHSSEKCLRILSRTGQVITNIATSPHYPSGVCLTKDGRHVAVCLYKEEKTSILQVYTTDGQLVQTFVYTKKKSQNCYPQKVATNESGDYFVAHNGLNTVFAITNSGSLRFTYDGSTAAHNTGPFHPYDIVCDSYNHLLVSDTYNNAIHMLTQEGTFLRYLLSYTRDGILQPRGICLDNKRKLWVGQKDGTLLVLTYLK